MPDSQLIHIALEGVDGCGKGTQVRLLTDYLKHQLGFDYVYKSKEPTQDTELGRRIRDEFHERTLPDASLNILFAADRVVHKMDMRVHAERLAQHTLDPVVYVSDRSIWSAYAYHGIKNPMHEFLSPESAQPDFTVVIDITVEEAMARMTAAGRELDRFENEARIEQARDAYWKLAEMHPDKIVVVNGMGELYQVAHEVCTRVGEWLR